MGVFREIKTQSHTAEQLEPWASGAKALLSFLLLLAQVLTTEDLR